MSSEHEKSPEHKKSSEHNKAQILRYEKRSETGQKTVWFSVLFVVEKRHGPRPGSTEISSKSRYNE